MKNNIKAQSLSLNTIIIVILVLLVLVVVGFFFIKGFGNFGDSTMDSCLSKAGICKDIGRCGAGMERYIPQPGENQVKCPPMQECCVYTN